MKNHVLAKSSAMLKAAAEKQMKVDAAGCRWFFYQPEVPQKILDRYKK